MRSLINILFLLVSLPLMGQVTLERQVISPYGHFGSASISISSTVGQVEYETISSDNIILTQGFQQPDSHNSELIVNWELDYPLCDNGQGAVLEVISIDGCSNDEYSITWNGEIVEAPILGIEAGTFSLQVTSTGGCSYSIEIIVPETSLLPCDLIFPNGFTPNSDSYNDFWEIMNIELDAYAGNQVSILNRWGNEVWKGDNYNNSTVVWDGRNGSGADLPQGTYFYVVTIGDLVFTGYIELMK